MEEISQISPARLARLLAGRARCDAPLHRQLSDGLAELIRLGEVPAGARLPSERSLAPALRMSRTTVTTAYSTLREHGLVEGRQGSGTYVLGRVGEREVEPGLAADDRLQAFTAAQPPRVVDLSSAAMPGLDLVAEVAEEGERGLRPLLSHHGYRPGGLPELRAAVADHLSASGLPTIAEQVLVTSGAQQALQILAGGLSHPGDRVIVEDPTYRGALTIFTAAGTRIRSVPSGPEGVDVEALAHTIAHTAPRFVFLLPAVHNPTGSVLPEAARLETAQLAARTATLIIEDVAAAETVYDDVVPRPIAAFSFDAEVITVGSLSKLFWGGLRIGWIRASESVIDRLTRVKGLTDLGSGVPSQLLALRLLPHAERARAARRRELLAGYERLTTALARQLPTWRPQVPRGGGSLWVRLPVDNAGRFAAAALQAGVRIAPGTLFSARDRFDDHIRLPFVADPATIELGVDRMAKAWEEFAASTPEPTTASVDTVV